MLTDDSPMDVEHVLMDRYWWGFCNAETVFNAVKRAGIDPAKLSVEKLRSITELTAKINSELVFPVGGNHFFYVGEQCASRAAKAIDTTITVLAHFKNEIDDLK